MKTTTAFLFVLLTLAGCSRGPELVPEVVALKSDKLPAGPEDSAWDRAPEHVARLLLQDLVEPRQMKATTQEVRVRALSDGARVVFRLAWADDNLSDAPGPAKMVDACAVQIPEKLSPEPPAPQMGDDQGLVQVTYWRADWQAAVNGRGDSIKDLYPNAVVDHYPFDAQSLEKGSDAQQEMARRYAPARALGNLRAGPREKPVEDLIANGPGTLSPGPPLDSAGRGQHSPQGWSVQISRKLPEGLSSNERTQIAFAVWQGSAQESGARKMRTGWIPLVVRSPK
jgi:DMSO reductase family type II enzyme heme b subunit